MRVDGGIAEVPVLPMRMGSYDLKSSVQMMFLVGYWSSLGRLSILCNPSGEIKYYSAV